MASILITPAENPLSKYSSYSYTASLYMISQDQFNELVQSSKRSVTGYQLLIQTGGAPTTAPGAKDPARNPHFSEDFYIDDIDIRNLITGRGNAGPNMTYELAFTVTEPYGITFLDRLKKASADLSKVQNRADSFETGLGQPYLFVLRFYGYDSNGKLIKGNNSMFSDSTAVSEKFCPFVLTEIKFRVTNNLVEYRCKGTPIWNQVGTGSTTGTIPIDLEVSGATVGEVLAGTGQSAQATAKSTIRSLADALNDYYKKTAAQGSIPNQIRFEFAEGAKIETAILKKDGPTNLQATPASMSTAPSDQHLEKKQSVKSAERNYSFTAGTSILQIINQLMQASSYIADQQQVKIAENGEVIANTSANKPLQWFLVTGRVEMKTDPATSNSVYVTTYRISPYQVYVAVDGFAPPEFRGTHKRYDYWFTGQNKEVLHFEQDYNFLYYQTMATQLSGRNLASMQQSSAREQEVKLRKVAQTGSAASSQGALSGANDIAASAAAALYSLADQATCKITIMGDPHWISEFDLIETGQAYDIFKADGSINMETRQILFEINFNTPTDYDLNTGLMNVNRTNYNRNASSRSAGDPTFSFIYMATNVVSTFKDGKFTQTLEGVLKPFYDTPSQSTSQSGGANSTRAIQGGTADMFTSNKFGKKVTVTTIDPTSVSPILQNVTQLPDSAIGLTTPEPASASSAAVNTLDQPKFAQLVNGTKVQVYSAADVHRLFGTHKIERDEYVTLIKQFDKG